MFRRLAAACLFAIAVTANAQSTSVNPVDCLFNWAAANYPNLFAPAGAPSGTFGPYYYRYYSQTNAYLGASSADLNVYYYNGAQPGLGVANMGAASSWLTIVACVSAASPASWWTFDATIFSTYGSDFGGVQGALADATVLPLTDGRYRMFVGIPEAPPASHSIHSAISSDGVRFTLESGLRVANPYRTSPTTTAMLGHPHVVRMDDGRVRLFLRGGNSPDPQPITGGIYSLTSTDEGTTFTLDPGPRISYAALGVRQTTGVSIVKMKTGGWRMYFAEEIPNNVNPTTGFITVGVNHVFSAFSTDLLTWTMDAGLRAGPGSAIANAGNATHPGSIANDDGSVTLIYYRNNPQSHAMMASTSTDGLNFTREVATPFAVGSTMPGADPFLMRLNTGEVRMYYNWGDNNGGEIYTARHAPFSASTSP